MSMITRVYSAVDQKRMFRTMEGLAQPAGHGAKTETAHGNEKAAKKIQIFLARGSTATHRARVMCKIIDSTGPDVKPKVFRSH